MSVCSTTMVPLPAAATRPSCANSLIVHRLRRTDAAARIATPLSAPSPVIVRPFKTTFADAPFTVTAFPLNALMPAYTPAGAVIETDVEIVTGP
jgi:hypothetical protein